MVLFDPFSIFDTSLSRSAAVQGFLPPIDVSVGESHLVLTMDLPGLTSEDVDVELLDGELIVRGERRRPELSDGATWTHAERRFGRFERRVRLPKGIDGDNVTASMDHGVLSLIVPKPERLRPRTVEIRTGEGTRQIETAAA